VINLDLRELMGMDSGLKKGRFNCLELVIVDILNINSLKVKLNIKFGWSKSSLKMVK